MINHPTNDWEFNDHIEESFVDWFNDLYGEFSLRSEWFDGDCREQDENQRLEIMRKWIHAAFVEGYERGFWEGTLND